MAKLFGIDFAPVQVPIERRLQTLSVMMFVILFLSPIIFSLLFLVLLLSPWYWLALGYGAWIVYDVNIKRVSSRGGRRVQWARKLSVWRYFRDYFPAKLVKTSDLSPDKNYLFGYHPHGILGCGAFCSFASEANGFSELFPNIKPHLLTLRANFSWPLLRGVLLYMGVCDVSKESIAWILSKQGTGNAAILVVGGAEEALNAHPGSYNLTLKQRKGFIKIAIRTGAELVPVFGFGENDLFAQVNNPEGSMLRSFQEKVKNIFGVSPPIYHGRGVFNYTFGLLPHRKPVAIVVGSPLPVVQCDAPSQEQIDKVHQEYMLSLQQLFDQHKQQYGIDQNKTIQFI